MAGIRHVDPTWWRSATFNGRPLPDILRERDVRSVFLFLKSKGWSRAAIAAATGLSETRVRAVAQGTQQITSYEVFERVADGFSIERGMLGLAYTTAGPGTAGHRVMAPPAAAAEVDRVAGDERTTVDRAMSQVDVENDLISETAVESAADAAEHSLYVGDDAIEDIYEQFTSYARRYSAAPKMEAFIGLRRTRDTARLMRDRTRRSRQLADLYLLMSGANSLLASLAFDLGRFEPARTLARAAASQGKAAGHRSAYVWAQGFLALLANWQGDPTRALEHCQRALDGPAPSAAHLRIRYIAARAHGLRGDRDAVAKELTLAEAISDRAGEEFDDLGHGVGGEFAFPEPRAAACAATAWLDAGDGLRAEQSAQAALSGYREQLGSDDAGSLLAGIWIDLATASLLQSDIRSADARLQEAFALVPANAGTAVTGRLRKARVLLSSPRWRGNPTARRLLDDLAG